LCGVSRKKSITFLGSGGKLTEVILEFGLHRQVFSGQNRAGRQVISGERKSMLEYLKVWQIVSYLLSSERLSDCSLWYIAGMCWEMKWRGWDIL